MTPLERSEFTWKCPRRSVHAGSVSKEEEEEEEEEEGEEEKKKKKKKKRRE